MPALQSRICLPGSRQRPSSSFPTRCWHCRRGIWSCAGDGAVGPSDSGGTASDAAGRTRKGRRWSPFAGPIARDPASGLLQLHVDDADVRKVFEMISRQGKVNILVSPSVTGVVTLDLRDMTVEEGIEAIARLCRLTIRREKDLVYVYTKAEADQGDDLPVRVYHLNYVRGSDLEKMIKPLLTKRGTTTASPDSEVGLKSDGSKSDTNKGYSLGTTDVLAGGNSLGGADVLIVQDAERVLQAVDRVVAQLDVQPVQVMIEAVILSVTLTDDMEFGVDFANAAFNGQVANVFGNGALLNSAAGFTPASAVATADSVASATLRRRRLVAAAGNAGAALAGSGHARARLQVRLQQQLDHRFYSGLGDSHRCQGPRQPPSAGGQQAARRTPGRRLPGLHDVRRPIWAPRTQTVNFMDVGTQLRLRPFVTSDGMIRMEIHPENSTGVLNAAGVPQTTGAHVTTNVMIPDGRTVVIGGLIEADRTYTKYGIPVTLRHSLDRRPVPPDR